MIRSIDFNKRSKDFAVKIGQKIKVKENHLLARNLNSNLFLMLGLLTVVGGSAVRFLNFGNDTK